MNKIISFFAVLVMAFGFQNKLFAQRPNKPRVIVTTDGEFDDRCSMVRFLLYANEFDVRGLIHSSSKFHWKGRGDDPGHDWHNVEWLDGHLAAYERIYDNLLLHNPDYPSPNALRKQVFVGNIELAGDMEVETPGSNHIVEVLLDPDPSPVWLQAWGGSNTIARALKTIEEKYPERKDEVAAKAKIFLIMLQDTTYESYIKPNWPSLTVMLSNAFQSIGYPWKKSIPKNLHEFYSSKWMNENVLVNHGPLTDIYKRHLHGAKTKTGEFISEGDSPSFMHQINTGLRGIEHPTYGDWGGRFEWVDGVWDSADDDGDKFKTVYRWIPAFQNDFAARADWCIESFENANHPPVVRISGEQDIIAKPGKKIVISAEKSTDPDGDELSFKWWQYQDAGSYEGNITLENINAEKISFTVPQDAIHGDTIHIICEVIDRGSPALTRYKRIIIDVKPF